MVEISEGARRLLFKNLTDASVPADTGYRLAEEAGKYELRLDRPSGEDRVLRGEGQVVFMVEPKVDEKLDGVVIELKEDDQTQLKMQVVQPPAGS